MWLGVGTNYDVYKVYPDMWSNFFSMVGQECPKSQCAVVDKFKNEKSDTFFLFSQTGSFKYQSGTVQGVFGQDKICLIPYRGCSNYKMRFLLIRSATEQFQLLKNATGILGLAPTPKDGTNYYDNLLSFLRINGLIEFDNFAFRVNYQFVVESLKINIDLSKESDYVTANLPSSATSWSLPIVHSNIWQSEKKDYAIMFDYNSEFFFVPPEEIANLMIKLPFVCKLYRVGSQTRISCNNCNPNTINLEPIPRKYKCLPACREVEVVEEIVVTTDDEKDATGTVIKKGTTTSFMEVTRRVTNYPCNNETDFLSSFRDRMPSFQFLLGQDNYHFMTLHPKSYFYRNSTNQCAFKFVGLESLRG